MIEKNNNINEEVEPLNIDGDIIIDEKNINEESIFTEELKKENDSNFLEEQQEEKLEKETEIESEVLDVEQEQEEEQEEKEGFFSKIKKIFKGNEKVEDFDILEEVNIKDENSIDNEKTEEEFSELEILTEGVVEQEEKLEKEIEIESEALEVEQEQEEKEGFFSKIKKIFKGNEKVEDFDILEEANIKEEDSKMIDSEKIEEEEETEKTEEEFSELEILTEEVVEQEQKIEKKEIEEELSDIIDDDFEDNLNNIINDKENEFDSIEVIDDLHNDKKIDDIDLLNVEGFDNEKKGKGLFSIFSLFKFNSKKNKDGKALKGDDDSSNIFDEFVDDSSLIEEVDKIKKESNRDMYFYVSTVGQFIQTIFWVCLFISIFLYSYIYIQNSDSKRFTDSNILDPFCFVILGDIEKTHTFCSSVGVIKSLYTEKLSLLKEKQSTDILEILGKVYEVENFTKTKEVLFLADKSINKLKVLSILEEFDNMKNAFDKIDKQKIQCDGISIDAQKKILSMKCAAYSAGFERGLRGFDGYTIDNSLKGTSLSIANSFLNYIQKQSKVFTIMDKQKIFKSENIVGLKTDFTNKTSFSLKLKYNIQ